MPANILYNAAYVTAKINSLKSLYPELADDYQLLADTIEGSTDFERVIEVITDEFLEALSMKGAVADRMESLRVRSARFEKKAEGLKHLALDLMKSAEQSKVVLPSATLSIRKGMSSVVVDDEAALPQGYFRTERTALKTEIKKALEKGDFIPGAHLVTGPDGLSVRAK